MKPEALLYKAQTIGNIEPIEYMIPYPSTQALIEGKTLKFGDQIIYEDYKITNIEFYKLVQKTANWLNDKGIQPKENVLIEDIGSPHTFLLLYGIWHLGARATLIDDSNNRVNNKLPIKKINLENDLLATIDSFPSDFTPKYKALLNETAVNIISKNNIIFLSHYGLLVNANSIQKSINLNAGERFFCDLLPTSSFWVVINAILPIYAGCIYTKKNPKITITFNEIDKESGYQLRTDWENLNDFKNHHIAVCVENSAAICINNNPIHLTDFKIKPKRLLVKGHSIMNGYLNKNNMLFENDYLAIQR